MAEARTPDDLDADDLPPLADDPLLDGVEDQPPSARERRAQGDLLPETRYAPHAFPASPGRPFGGGTATDAATTTGMAGGVLLVRTTAVGPRLAVMESGGVVSLPKAEVGEGMRVETAASDAALAFTGQRVRLVESIGETEEILDGLPMTTWFWLARPARARTGDTAGPTAAGFTLHWVELDEALHILTSGAERALVERIRHRPFRQAPRPLASPERVALAHDLQAFRDQSLSAARTSQHPEREGAFLRARDEIERAEERLDRGDAPGARRARARAERETLVTLDREGRAIAFRRILDRAPDHLRPALTAAVPESGQGVSLEVLTAVHAAVDAALEEDERGRDARRAAQGHATVALAATAAAVLVAASLDLFRTVPRPVLDPITSALVFIVSGALGGWVGEALHSLRERDARSSISLPMASAAGGLAGLALGAFLSGGLGDTMLSDAALTLSATFAAGWIVRTLLPR